MYLLPEHNHHVPIPFSTDRDQNINIWVTFSVHKCMCQGSCHGYDNVIMGMMVRDSHALEHFLCIDVHISGSCLGYNCVLMDVKIWDIRAFNNFMCINVMYWWVRSGLQLCLGGVWLMTADIHDLELFYGSMYVLGGLVTIMIMSWWLWWSQTFMISHLALYQTTMNSYLMHSHDVSSSSNSC